MTELTPSSRLPGLALILGSVVLLFGLGLTFTASTPLGTAAMAALAAVPMLVVGGGLVCLALIGLTVGWGHVAGPLPLGSHRSVVATMVLALVMGGALGAIFVAVTWPSMEMAGVLAAAG